MSKNKLFCAFFASALLLLSSCAEKPKEYVPDASLITPEQTNYETVAVKKQDYTKTATGGASVQYPTSCELTWDTANSRLEEIYVTRGDAVQEGQILATFNTKISASELENLRLQLQRAEEALEEGKAERMKEINHAKRILDYNFSREKKIAQLELESMQISYDMYVYEQENAIAELQEKIYEIESLVTENAILAPYDGIIDWVVSYNPGDAVDKGKIIFRMHSTDEFIVYVSDGANKLRYNQEVILEAGRKNQRKTYTGRVITAPNVLPDGINVAVIRADEGVTAKDLEFAINFTVNQQEMRDVIIVNRTLLAQENGQFYVGVLEDDMVKKRYVTVGSGNLQEYWILDGLTEGQNLVAN